MTQLDMRSEYEDAQVTLFQALLASQRFSLLIVPSESMRVAASNSRRLKLLSTGMKIKFASWSAMTWSGAYEAHYCAPEITSVRVPVTMGY
jgi:hypothetical protein